MNAQQYYESKKCSMDVMKMEYLRVTPKTLFRKKEFVGLTEHECHKKAIALGWGWDSINDKYYRVIDY